MTELNQDEIDRSFSNFDKCFLDERFLEARQILNEITDERVINTAAFESRLGSVLIECGEHVSARIVFQSMLSHWDGSIDQFIYIVSMLLKSRGEIEAEIVILNKKEQLKRLRFSIQQLKQMVAISNILETREVAIELLDSQKDTFSGVEVASLHLLYVSLYKQAGDLANEAEHLAMAIETDPKSVPAHGMAADLFTRHRKPSDSLGHLRMAENLSGHEGNKSIATQFFESCRGGSFQEQERLRKLWLENPDSGQNTRAPFAALVATDDPDFILTQNKLFASDIGVDTRRLSFSSISHEKIRATDKITVGYFSPDFRNHAVSHLISELLINHDKNMFEVHCFSIAMPSNDDYRRIVKEGVDFFHEVEELGTRDIAKLANNLDLDIAIDLAGYTAGFRPLLFERLHNCFKINFLGYPSTVGDSIYDYIIGDNIVTPEGYESYCSEKIHRLQRCYQCNSPSRKVVDIERQDTGLPDDCFVFCNFNTRQKLNLITMKAWARILERCPNAVLWLLDPGPQLKDEYLGVFGQSSSRVYFAPHLTVEAHLGRVHHANLFLDSFPYGAHTTASDAVFAGIPVLTMSGRAFQSRVSWSIMSHAGVDDLNVFNWEDYETRAVEYYCEYSDSVGLRYQQTLLDRGGFTHPYNLDAYKKEYQEFLASLFS